jgi:hypothetical protein
MPNGLDYFRADLMSAYNALHIYQVKRIWRQRRFVISSVDVFCIGKKVKESRNRLSVAQKFPGDLGSQISWHSAYEGGEVVSLKHRPLLPPGLFLVFIFTRGWVDPRAMEWSEVDMSLKNPVTPPGIDPGTSRLLAQRLDHYATPGPSVLERRINFFASS